MKNPYFSRPWRELYSVVAPAAGASPPDVLTAFDRALAADPMAPAVHYFDRSYTYAWLEQQSNALAVWLTENTGLRRGDRLAIVLQNVPYFVVAVVAAWKLDAVPMPCNPMYREQELGRLFSGAAPAVVICHRDHYACVQASISLAGLALVPTILTVCARDLQSRDDDRILPPRVATPAGSVDLGAVITSCLGRRPEMGPHGPREPALLQYTSGTTGAPKGALISHRALASSASQASRLCPVRAGARVFALAPLFHITGFNLHLCVAFCAAGSIVLTYRFEPRVALDAFLEHRPAFMAGAITAYIALMNAPPASPAHFVSFDSLHSGGAPIPGAVVEQFAARLGRRIRTGFGMTEFTGPSHLALTDFVPVDSRSGLMAVGIPLPEIDAEIRGDDGNAVAIGELGELVVRGPQLMDRYRDDPLATAEAMPDGWMHTGDIAFMDANGWFYIVDRKKDVINAAGYKVWPREVEEVLYQHPAVREVAIVGAPDGYRGESVHAFVSLKNSGQATAAELIAYCRERLAVYKAPRHVEFVSELPKTASGKIIRAELRAAFGRRPPGDSDPTDV